MYGKHLSVEMTFADEVVVAGLFRPRGENNDTSPIGFEPHQLLHPDRFLGDRECPHHSLLDQGVDRHQ